MLRATLYYNSWYGFVNGLYGISPRCKWPLKMFWFSSITSCSTYVQAKPCEEGPKDPCHFPTHPKDEWFKFQWVGSSPIFACRTVVESILICYVNMLLICKATCSIEHMNVRSTKIKHTTPILIRLSNKNHHQQILTERIANIAMDTPTFISMIQLFTSVICHFPAISSPYHPHIISQWPKSWQEILELVKRWPSSTSAAVAACRRLWSLAMR